MDDPSKCGVREEVDAQDRLQIETGAVARFGKEDADVFLEAFWRGVTATETCWVEHDKATAAQAALEKLLRETDEQYRTDARAAVADLAARASGRATAETGEIQGESEAEEELRRLANEEPEAVWAILTGSSRGPVRAEDARLESTRIKNEALEAVRSMQTQATVVAETMAAFANLALAQMLGVQ